MNPYRFFSIFLVVISIIGCEPERPPSIIDLKIDTTTSSLNDSTFISQITDLAADGNSVVAADHARGQVFKFDLSLHHVATYGEIGTHRGEFQIVSFLTVDRDSIYVLNNFGQSLEIFGRPDTISARTVAFPKAFNANLVRTNFIHRGGLFYTSVPKSGYSILEFDGGGVITSQFGDLFKDNEQELPSLQNSRVLLRTDDDKILSIADTRPIVEEFDLNGKLLFSTDLESEFQIRKNLEFIKKNESVSGEFYTLYRDAFYSKGSVFLLCNVIGEEESANVVLKCLVTTNGLEVKQRWKLPGRWYWCLAVEGNNLFAYEASLSQIQKFKI